MRDKKRKGRKERHGLDRLKKGLWSVSELNNNYFTSSVVRSAPRSNARDFQMLTKEGEKQIHRS